MKKISLFLLLLLSSLLRAQEVNCIKGPEFTTKENIFNGILAEDRTAFYVMRSIRKGGKKHYTLEKHNKKTFEVEWSSSINYEEELKLEFSLFEPQDILVKFNKKEISLIYWISHPALTKSGIYMTSLDINTGSQVRPIRLLMEHAGMYLSFSKDSTLLVTKTTHTFTDNGGAFQGTVYVNIHAFEKITLFDLEKGKEIFAKNLPIRDGDFDIACTDVEVDNKGNVACYYTRFGVNKNRLGQITSYGVINYGICKIPANSDKATFLELDYSLKENTPLKSVIVHFSDNLNYVVINGYVIDGPSKGDPQRNVANFFVKVDLTNLTLVAKKTEYFDEQAAKVYADIKDIYGGYDKLFTKESIIDPVTDDVYLISYGSVFSIFVTHFDKNGNVLWTKAVPRHAPNDITSFSYAYRNKTIYFLFLDSKKNIADIDINNFEIRNVADFNSPFGQNLICISIGKTGNLKRNVVGVMEKKTPIYLPEETENLSKKSIYHFRDEINGKKEQYVSFDFK